MKLGTITLGNRLYNLDYMKEEELIDIYNKCTEQTNEEISKVKKISNRENKNSELDISIAYKNFLTNTSSIFENEACIYRAIIEKTTINTINTKVKNQRNSFNVSIKKINSRFSKNKKYKDIQEKIEEALKNYEKVLTDIANFYDIKIEQLILKKVELQAHLVGKIFREEFYFQEEEKHKNSKENDNLLNTLSNGIKSAISKLKTKKAEKEIDITMISKLKDKEELEIEQKENIENSLVKNQNDIQDNRNDILKIENEILTIQKEIDRINQSKKDSLMNFIESSNKNLAIRNEKNRVIGSIKKFIFGKFNTYKYIYDTIITPFNNRINDYIENELKDMKSN